MTTRDALLVMARDARAKADFFAARAGDGHSGAVPAHVKPATNEDERLTARRRARVFRDAAAIIEATAGAKETA